ncbi:hydantoinase [Kwoniella mangroviensis CBS 10435]|uniref:Hydantoinase n=1 Tax=Kwoniella mangroviensis CBS 10435 TaxID=1331196 RepID=A0A1B9IZ68_9TREE|nr:hydantoinase [Kwoniella mangroviensis CBS 10435]
MVGNYSIGVDVGGTNIDAVILDVSSNSTRPILATHKSPTTPDVTTGIQGAIEQSLRKATIDKCSIQAIFIGPFSRLAPPFVSFPYELRHVLEGPCFFAEGGLQVDGSEITSEELVREILYAEIPGVKVCISKEVANIGLLQRENATILNAALLEFAQLTVSGFKESTHALHISCPLFLTSNDGTLMTCEMAAKFPIKTFSSGPTNSMRGANFLARLGDQQRKKETALVMDVGGTTTEIGVLLPTGFPRQASAYHELCGVPLNFSMPHVYSIGLGGGSRVRKDSNRKTTIGPDSVGYRIHELGRAFGGDILTTTDIVFAAGRASSIGDPELVKDIAREEVFAAQEKIRQMIESAVDCMKTSVQDIPVYLVGGGAILVPDELKGVSTVYRPQFYDAANAVGAACAQISGFIDTLEDTSKLSIAEVQKIVEQHTTGRCRFYVKAAGEWTGAADNSEQGDTAKLLSLGTPRTWDTQSAAKPAKVANADRKIPDKDHYFTAEDIISYKPSVTNGEWTLSELDIEWISTGCYILGTGGGGNPHNVYLALREMFRAGSTCKVIDIQSLDPDKVVMYGGGIGSPEVAAEKLLSSGSGNAAKSLLTFMGYEHSKLGALSALEIGGGNGMVAMIRGSSKDLNVPIIDGDFMGRAYPTGWQTTVNVYATDDQASMVLSTYMSSGDGTELILTKVKHYKEVDSILRAACMEMGTSAQVVARPLTKVECERALIRNTVSQSWRIGRAVALANKQANIDNIGSVLVNALGGSDAAKVLFEGKIVQVGRRLYKGHSYGEIEIHAMGGDEATEDPNNPQRKFRGVMKIPFKNENLLAEHMINGRTEVVCGVPDLISVLDAQNGTALGTPEYKYGQRVIVIGITAAPQWTDTPRGLELGSLTAFGYDLPYKPLGTYVKPRSVTEEYAA